MPMRQRLLFGAVAVLLAVVAAVALLGPESSPEQPTTVATPDAPGEGPAADQEAMPAPTATPTATPTPLLTVNSVRTLRFREGDTVRFQVRHPDDDELHVHGYDITRDVPAGETVTVSFPASITGIFEVELHGSHEPLGRLEITP